MQDAVTQTPFGAPVEPEVKPGSPYPPSDINDFTVNVGLGALALDNCRQ